MKSLKTICSHLSERDCDVPQGLEGRLIRFLDHVRDHLDVLEDCQPEMTYAFDVLFLLLLGLLLLLGELCLLVDLLGQGGLILVLFARVNILL